MPLFCRRDSTSSPNCPHTEPFQTPYVQRTEGQCSLGTKKINQKSALRRSVFSTSTCRCPPPTTSLCPPGDHAAVMAVHPPAGGLRPPIRHDVRLQRGPVHALCLPLPHQCLLPRPKPGQGGWFCRTAWAILCGLGPVVTRVAVTDQEGGHFSPSQGPTLKPTTQTSLLTCTLAPVPN